jgi:hypothetical protein
METQSIKTWYQANYPTDDLGDDLNDVSFKDLLNAMNDFIEVYEFIGVHDSVVRERLFERLSDLMGTDYLYIYNLWVLKEYLN